MSTHPPRRPAATRSPTIPDRAPVFARLFADRPVLLATIHLPPLPGAPGHDAARPFDPQRLVTQVRREAELLSRGGFDGLIVENFGDIPFLPGRLPAHTIASLAILAREAHLATGLPVGINALRNDASGALGAAVAAGVEMIRVNVHTGAAVTDQGLIEGRAGETLRYRAALGAETMILADVEVKHARSLGPGDLDQKTCDCVRRGMADAVIVTGPATGTPPCRDDLATVRRAAGKCPVLAGSGTDPGNIREILEEVSGVIVSSALRRGARPGARLDPGRVERFVRAARGV